MSIALSIQDVHVTLGHFEVLKGVSLDAEPGTFVTLLGASGSGKTTLLNVIAGLQQLDRGHVLFDGQNVERRPPRKRKVGVVFQSYALFPHMSVGDNVAFPLRAARRPSVERRKVVQEMLELVDLAGMVNRAPASLSGGQRQRVALARALASDPGILLLDEPMAALDKQLRERMQVEIKRIQQQVGITTVAVTHDQAEAMTMSDQVAIMHEGTLVQVDSPENLYRRPVNEYVASFLGEANLFPADRGGPLALDAAGQATGTAVIRPEDLVVLAPDQLGDHWRVPGVVRLLSFQGSRFRLEVVTATGRSVVCSLPPHTDASALVPGSEVILGCGAPDRVHVIHRSDAGDALEVAA
ncbi:ABC transporter ATP-binding protein [Micromonospora endophytica]|uniref:ABC-type quaternary amine transporter n=1 Tax=Micromonospora endophytica TaxID=515350 RepID=A0A2W2D5Q8_9ACTN|nr:ABC transporter ATP-binding protein [Micromonospora endophytica]PZF99028.1 polyamine ABC transporter ATP-binding protein [Micromonospora endophytica]RIW51378.1 ABC transporter ATP-binding protein [Micromonospora endophytica]BCJ62068.1 spermidine/putrescine ABC transporter ATP-binding protein [Micromonospora endophytica]